MKNQQLKLDDYRKLPNSGDFEADMDYLASLPTDEWLKFMGSMRGREDIFEFLEKMKDK